MSQRLTVKEAAAEIGCNVEYLRRQMKAGRWDLGSVIKPNAKVKNYQYFYLPGKAGQVSRYRTKSRQRGGGE